MLKIIYDNRSLTLDGEKSNIQKLKVKDLINSIKKSLKIGENDKNFSLIEENRSLMEEEEINLVKDLEKVFYLIEKRNFNVSTSEVLKNSQIDELIMKVTGGKDKPVAYKVVKPKKRLEYGNNYEQQLFEHILQSSSTTNSSVTGTIERLSAIRSLIRDAQDVLVEGQSTSPRSIIRTNNVNTTGTNVNISSIPNTSSYRPYYGYSRPAVIQPDPAMINNLKEMGFEEDRIKRVLIANSNDLAAATEMLLNDTDLALADDIPTNTYNYYNQGYYNYGYSLHTNNQNNNHDENNEGGENEEIDPNDVDAMENELLEMENEMAAEFEVNIQNNDNVNTSENNQIENNNSNNNPENFNNDSANNN